MPSVPSPLVLCRRELAQHKPVPELRRQEPELAQHTLELVPHTLEPERRL